MDSSSGICGASHTRLTMDDDGRTVRRTKDAAPGGGRAPASVALQFRGSGKVARSRRMVDGRPVVALRAYMSRRRRRAREHAERVTRAAGLTTRSSWSAVLWGWISTRTELGGGNPDADVMALGSDELARACAVMLQETWYEWFTDRRQSRVDRAAQRRTRVA